MIAKYRFWEMLNGRKMYLRFDDGETLATDDPKRATLFTERDWSLWGDDGDLQREEIPEDEAMRLIGAPMLPGMEE